MNPSSNLGRRRLAQVVIYSARWNRKAALFREEMDLSKCLSYRGIAVAVDGLFFPQRVAMGLDSRDITPQLVRILIHLSAEVRSFERVSRSLELLGHALSSCTVRRLVGQVGNELSQQHESFPSWRSFLVMEAGFVHASRIMVPASPIPNGERQKTLRLNG